jgi:hypothetical protein
MPRKELRKHGGRKASTGRTITFAGRMITCAEQTIAASKRTDYLSSSAATDAIMPQSQTR